MLLYAGCNIQKPITATPSGNDTLYTTIVRNTTEQRPGYLYRFITQKTANTFDTIYSDTVPPTTIQTAFGSTGDCGQVRPITLITYTFTLNLDTLYRMVDDPASQDTIFIFDTSDVSHIVYRDTISCRIDTIESYRKSHKPYFYNKDSMATVLGNDTEGLRQYILLPAFHFDNDSATIELVDNPSWAHLEWVNVSEGYGDCWFYRTCVNGIPVATMCSHWIAKKSATSTTDDCERPYVVLAPDSTALDSTYRWKVFITNKYAQADTMSVVSTVTPFPYKCP